MDNVSAKHEKLLVSTSKEYYEKTMINFIKTIVSTQLNKPIGDASENKRQKTLDVLYRQVCIYVIDLNLEMTSAAIGLIFEKKHSTVLHAKKTINNYLGWDKDLKKNIDEIQKLITLKTHALFHESDLSKQFYYLDLNNYTSLRVNSSKGIIMLGLTESEEFAVKNALEELKTVKSRKHTNTNLYVFEENAPSENNNVHNENTK